MMRIYCCDDAAAMMAYHGDALEAQSIQAGYHFKGLEQIDVWRGDASERMNLEGVVQKEHFDAVIKNQHPHTGKQLTDKNKDGRRVGYDFNFHLPKGVSLLYAVTEDQRILDAFKATVHKTMARMEKDVQVRMRDKGRNDNIVAGNWAYASFLHFNSRPVDGVSDPHIHMHCVVPNTVWCPEKLKWKAIDVSKIKSEARLYEAAFHNDVHQAMKQLGCPTARDGDWWDVTCFDKSTKDRFSKRTLEIEKMAKELGIVDPYAKAELGAKTRDTKTKEIERPPSVSEACHRWRQQMTEAERSLQSGPNIQDHPITAQRCVEQAIEHHFARRSGVKMHQLEETALRLAGGQVTNEVIHATLYKHPELIISTDDDQVPVATTRQALKEEQEMLHLYKEGKGAYRTLAPFGYEIEDPNLASDASQDQRNAITHVWESTHFCTIIRGVAGAGKSHMMPEMVRGIMAGGRQVVAIAPTITASRGQLREAGFKNANTLTSFLSVRSEDGRLLREKAKNGVILVDEAGMVGTRDMLRLFKEAKQLNARIVCIGDELQHKSVDRGDALRVLKTKGGIAVAELGHIHRQKGEYKKAVELMSQGHAEKSLNRIDKLGWVVEEKDAKKRYAQLAKEYVDIVTRYRSRGRKESIIAVTPTHVEGFVTTDAVRTEMKERGLLTGPTCNVMHHHNLHWDDTRKKDLAHYQTNMTVRFKRHVKGFDPTKWYIVKGRLKNTLQVVDSVTGQQTALPLDRASSFDVHVPRMIELMDGDRIRMTRTIQDQRGRRLNKGNMYQFKGVDDRGFLKLDNGSVLNPMEGCFNHAITVTSHSSQSLTVDHVFLAASAMSAAAISLKLWYVTLSRGRIDARVFADCKEHLKRAIQNDGTDLSSTDIAQRWERDYAGKAQWAMQHLRDQAQRQRHQHSGYEHAPPPAARRQPPAMEWERHP